MDSIIHSKKFCVLEGINFLFFKPKKKVKKIKHAHNIAMKYVFVIPKNKCSPVKPSTCISFNYTSILKANKEKVKFLYASITYFA